MKPKCFVLMPFAEDVMEVYEHAIHPAAKTLGFNCYRADHAVGSCAIVSDIIKGIFQADVIVADLSGFNPNVFYELGVAHTVGNKTIIICERTKQELPFDLKSYRVIFYDKSIKGIKEELRGRLEKTLRDFSTWSAQRTNPVQDFRPVQYAVPLAEQEELERSIGELRSDLRRLQDEKRRGELRALIFALPEIQFRHLRNLMDKRAFDYVKRAAFLDELRKLRGFGLIRTKEGATIGGIPETGDLKQYIEVTDLAREVLEEIVRWVSP